MTPEIIEDEVLGKMIWDSENKLWTNQMTLPSGLVASIGFDIGLNAEPNEIADGLVRARRSYLLVRNSEEAVRRAASAFLLEIFNEGDWCEGKPLDENAFIARMTLESAVFSEEGSADLYYNDGDLFWGHVIIVSITSEGIVEDAEIAG